MISVQNLHKTYGRLRVLDNLSVDLKAGQAVSLIGPNGSGKTTLIKSILGLVVPDSGEIRFHGEPIGNGWQYRNHIGYMPQIGRYPDNMRIGQVFDMMKDLRNPEWYSGKGSAQPDRNSGKGKKYPTSSSEINLIHPEYHSGLRYDEDLIRAFDLPKLYQKTMRSLSGGTRQKVSACLAFLFNPQVLILDEPTAGLDPLAAEVLKEKILLEKQKGKLILITSHVMSDLDELTTDVMYLQDGRLQFFREVDWLKDVTGEEKLGRAIASVMSRDHSSELVIE